MDWEAVSAIGQIVGATGVNEMVSPVPPQRYAEEGFIWRPSHEHSHPHRHRPR